MSDPGPADELEDLFETAPCGLVSIRPDGRVARLNQTLADWLHRPVDSIIGKPLFDFLAFGTRIAFETHLTPLLRMQGHVHEVAIEMLDASGERVPAIANAAEKRDSNGRHLFTRMAILKAVDRRTYERTLIDRRAAAEEEVEAERAAILLRDQFMAVLGHDLRNPLAAIRAGVGVLTRNEVLTDRGSLVLAETKRSVDRAAALVNDLLDLARGSLGGGIVVERETGEPLSPLLEHVVAEVRAISPDHRIVAKIDIEEPVFCDRGRMGQLASNLLSNAVSHGSPDRPIRFEALARGEQFMLLVANAGEPIPPAAMEHLFQPFFRGDTRPSAQGLGLGLYIVSQIAAAHGGQLEVVSNEEETVFTFTMQRMPADRL